MAKDTSVNGSQGPLRGAALGDRTLHSETRRERVRQSARSQHRQLRYPVFRL